MDWTGTAQFADPDLHLASQWDVGFTVRHTAIPLGAAAPERGGDEGELVRKGCMVLWGKSTSRGAVGFVLRTFGCT